MFEPIWNLENIKAGLERFVKENGRLPVAREMDKIGYLPTARTIQREYGGLEQLRKNLGFSITHFNKGEYSSKRAALANIRSRDSEAQLQRILTAKFGEMFVHLQRPFSPDTRQRLDFYVFSPSGNFGVDVFYAKDLDSMINNLNLKLINYEGYLEPLYLVVITPANIPQELIDPVVSRKQKQLPKNYSVQTVVKFEASIKGLGIYRTLTGEK